MNSPPPPGREPFGIKNTIQGIQGDRLECLFDINFEHNRRRPSLVIALDKLRHKNEVLRDASPTKKTSFLRMRQEGDELLVA